MKRLLSILLLILLATSSVALLIKPAKAGEEMSNGGFETGNFTDWDAGTFCEVVSAEKHSGTYSALLDYSESIHQDLSVTFDDITSCTVWVKKDVSGMAGNSYITWTTTAGSDNFLLPSDAGGYDWTEFDILAEMSGASGTLTEIGFLRMDDISCNFWTDDFSIVTEPAPPPTFTLSGSVSPVGLAAHFSIKGSGAYPVPYSDDKLTGYYWFTCLEASFPINSSSSYTFSHWLINGTTEIESLSTGTFYCSGTTSIQMVYALTTLPPSFPFIYQSGALNVTLYERSDDWTVHGTLGYRLDTVNTNTPAFDSHYAPATPLNTSYGVRIWTVDFLGNYVELTSGSPAAIVTSVNLTAEMWTGYWNCPAYSSMIDSIHVRVYQRWNGDIWTLSRYFITKTGLYWRLPASTWTFNYYVNHTDYYSIFGHGSYNIYNSRILLQYYKASPWDIAMARLQEGNFVGFMFTPWTYYLGDLFWTILLLGCVTMSYLRFGSFKMPLAVLWILGGSGSILWALIPAVALHVAVLMLALAMAITLFRIVK